MLLSHGCCEKWRDLCLRKGSICGKSNKKINLLFGSITVSPVTVFVLHQSLKLTLKLHMCSSWLNTPELVPISYGFQNELAHVWPVSGGHFSSVFSFCVILKTCVLNNEWWLQQAFRRINYKRKWGNLCSTFLYEFKLCLSDKLSRKLDKGDIKSNMSTWLASVQWLVFAISVLRAAAGPASC